MDYMTSNITNNVISNNGVGIALSNLQSPAVSQYRNNSILNNQTYNFTVANLYNYLPIVIESNWWGTTDLTQIKVKILDCEDNQLLPCVDVNPFLNGANGSPVSAVVPIVYGKTIIAALTSPAAIDKYSFSAQAGDMIEIPFRTVVGSYQIVPRVQIYNAQNVKLAEVVSPDQKLSYTVPLAGTYTVRISDAASAGGNYEFTFIKKNNPAAAAPWVYGQSLNVNRYFVTQMDAFQFTALAGDKVFIPWANTIPDYFGPPWLGNLKFVLYDSNFTIVTEFNPNSGNPFTITIPANGTYYVWAEDLDASHAYWSYQLTLERRNTPADEALISFGQTVVSLFAYQTEQDVYSFTAQTGDKIVLPFNFLNGTNWNYLRIEIFKASDSTKVTEKIDAYKGTFEFTVPSAGQYYIWISNQDYIFTGDYQFTLERRNNPVNTIPMALGETKFEGFPWGTQFKKLVFSAQQGDKILIPFVRTTPYLENVIIEVYRDSDSLKVAQDNNNFGSLEFTAPSTGQYDIWLLSPSLTLTDGNADGYEVSLYRRNNPLNPIPYVYWGESVTAQFQHNTSYDVYKINAEAGDKIEAVFDGTYDASELYDSSWNKVAEAPGGVANPTILYDVPAAGQYYLWAHTFFMRSEQYIYTFTLKTPPLISNVTMGPQFFNPLNNETATLQFDLSQDSLVTIKLYKMNHDPMSGNYSKDYVTNLTTGLPQAKGPRTFLWNGKDAGGKLFKREAYYFVLEAASTFGNRRMVFDPNPELISGPVQISNSAFSPAVFDPYKGEEAAISFNLLQPAWVSICVGDNQNNTIYSSKILDARPRKTSVLEKWDGYGEVWHTIHYHPSGLLDQVAVAWTVILPDNVMVVDVPDYTMISDFYVDPYAIYAAYSNVANLNYTLVENAYVMVDIYEGVYTAFEGVKVRQLMTDQLQNIGTYHLIWDGRDDAGKIVAPGNYTAVITTRSVDGTITDEKGKNIKVFK